MKLIAYTGKEGYIAEVSSDEVAMLLGYSNMHALINGEHLGSPCQGRAPSVGEVIDIAAFHARAKEERAIAAAARALVAACCSGAKESQR